MSKKDTVTAATSEGNVDSHVVDIAGDGNHNPWLNAIMAAEDEQIGDTKTVERPQIKKVERMRVPIKDYRKYRKYTHPQEVSLGPIHRDNKKLQGMEPLKKIAAKRFLSNKTEKINLAYRKVSDFEDEARQCYDASIFLGNDLRDEEVFTQLMFLDGCFIAYFIEKSNNETIELEMGSRLFRRIVSDIFLLENQLPFVVLHELMKWRFGRSSTAKEQILKFITRQTTLTNFIYSDGLPRSQHHFWRGQRLSELFGGGGGEALHLLDILRRMLLGSPVYWAEELAEMPSYTPHQFGSVTELKQAGIRFGMSDSGHLTSVRFVRNFLFPKILLPAMVINDATISQILNLIALESCFDSPNETGVTSFLRLMDSLINHAADVQELRVQGILHHALGSDEEVAKLFNELPVDTAGDLPVYRNVKRRILRHRDRIVRVSIAGWLHTHFKNAWTAFAFAAAILLLFLTAVQTICTVFPRT